MNEYMVAGILGFGQRIPTLEMFTETPQKMRWRLQNFLFLVLGKGSFVPKLALS